jgi:hypothetical protein
MRRDFSPSEAPRSMSKDDQMYQSAKLTEPTVKERTLGGRVYFQKLNTKMESRNGETKQMTYEHVTGSGPTKIHVKRAFEDHS